MDNTHRLGQILLRQESISQEELDTALEEQAERDQLLGQLLLARRALTPVQLCNALAQQSGIPCASQLPEAVSETALLELLPLNYVKEHGIMPLEWEDESLRVVIADPYATTAINDLEALVDAPLNLCLAPAEDILGLINRSYEIHAGGASEMVADMDGDQDGNAPRLEPDDLLDSSDEAPVIRFVNSLITQAYKERASDIHIEPFENELVVRYRIDGILYEVLRPPQNASASINSRIKIMAGLNIAEKRLPQDGRFRVRIAAKDIDVRVSSLPTAFGERLVLRLLDKSSNVLALEDIGMKDELLRRVEKMIASTHGVFLVTGPTGSGKTTTLYAALSRLDRKQKNIITVEDPIEYQLSGVGQIQVNAKIDLTFANGLRSILRQDPDVIMVGEIRDQETAEIAIQSALTGHMVFSTLHTNDAAGGLTRLVEMGIEPFLAASSVVGILAQRLVRSICPHCRETYTPETTMLERLNIDPDQGHTFYRGRGCAKCMDIGYRGRTGVYELLSINEKIRAAILANADAGTIRTMAIEGGMTPLRNAGLELARQGITTLEEVIRVTQEEN
ncbi:MAG: type II secretion system ATPase GspE [Desulfuromonadaceae bacterium]